MPILEDLKKYTERATGWFRLAAEARPPQAGASGSKSNGHDTSSSNGHAADAEVA